VPPSALVTQLRGAINAGRAGVSVYTVRSSMVEIYNEAVIDLLAVSDATNSSSEPKDLKDQVGGCCGADHRQSSQRALRRWG
jgi:hypothetical protein